MASGEEIRTRAVMAGITMTIRDGVSGIETESRQTTQITTAVVASGRGGGIQKTRHRRGVARESAVRMDAIVVQHYCVFLRDN
jgi:hypothetical protein